ncbi:hypothetical protein HK104_004453, partial [Borealophlyctis nickersoniae]
GTTPPPAIRLGLDNIRRLLQSLSNPQNNLNIVHVAGTNGKGSICAYISTVLTHCGYTTGCFTSPHLLHPSDAIRINDRVVSQSEYDSVMSRVDAAARANGLFPSPFEKQTAAAFCLFAEKRVDVAVVEVGLGGRLDATNACGVPKVCVFSAIGRDHVDFLGDSIGGIAKEKAGIIKPRAAVVIGPQPESEAAKVLRGVAAENQCDVSIVEPSSLAEDGVSAVGHFNGHPIQFPLPLLGDFQLSNVATALKALEVLRSKKPDITIPEDKLKSGLAAVRWPGRLEWMDVPKVGRMLVDGAHNEPAAQVLGKFVDVQRNSSSSSSVAWVIGMTKGKDARGILRHLLKEGDSVYAVPFSQPDQMPWIHSAPVEELRESVHSVVPGVEFEGLGSVKGALDALATRKDRPGLVVLCGSLYLVADLYREVGLSVP